MEHPETTWNVLGPGTTQCLTYDVAVDTKQTPKALPCVSPKQAIEMDQDIKMKAKNVSMVPLDPRNEKKTAHERI